MAPFAECARPINWPNAVKRLDFMRKWWNLYIFCIFMYIWWFLIFVLFLLKVYQSGKYYQQKNTNFLQNGYLLPTLSTLHDHRHWGIGISRYTFESTILTQAIPPSCWSSGPRPLQATYRDSNGHPYLQLYRKGAYYLWSNSETSAKKVWHLMKSIPLTAEFIYMAPYAECTGPINQPNAVNVLRN